MDGLEFFPHTPDSTKKNTNIVAVKQLHGECETFMRLLLNWCRWIIFHIMTILLRTVESWSTKVTTPELAELGWPNASHTRFPPQWLFMGWVALYLQVTRGFFVLWFSTLFGIDPSIRIRTLTKLRWLLCQILERMVGLNCTDTQPLFRKLCRYFTTSQHFNNSSIKSWVIFLVDIFSIWFFTCLYTDMFFFPPRKRWPWKEIGIFGWDRVHEGSWETSECVEFCGLLDNHWAYASDYWVYSSWRLASLAEREEESGKVVLLFNIWKITILIIKVHFKFKW